MIITYRVFQEANGQYTIREVFHEQDGRLITYGRSPVIPKGGSITDLAEEIEALKAALALPVLTVAEVEAEIAAQPTLVKPERRTISHAELMKRLDFTTEDNQSPNESIAIHAAD
ncbi:MAG: hypothetical protein U0350_29650 [Caldilineaceae bacterium]